MKLAHFVVPHIGGTYSVHRSLRAGLAPRGVAVRWIGLGAGAAAVLRDDCWAHERARGEAVALAAGTDRRAARKLVEHLERERYDGVIIGALCGRLETNVLRHLPERLLRLLIVHNITPGTYLAARAVRDHVHAAVGVSPRIASDLIRSYGFDAARTHVVPNGLDLEPFMRAVRHEPAAPLRVTFLGRLEDQSKGIFWLPRIVSMLDDMDVRLTIAGDGPDRRRLEALCAPLADRVEFLGRVLPAQVPELLAGRDVLLMPSRYEGFGYTLIEAMAAGCVPVVSRIKGVTDAVAEDGVTGLLFPIGSVKAAAEAIRRLAHDRVLLKRMAASCRCSAARFSTDAMAASYAAILSSIATAPPNVAKPLPLHDWRYPAGLKPGLRTYLPTEIKNTLRLWRERWA
jgi:glycosyltransferase involved in cell wall biosynthesis